MWHEARKQEKKLKGLMVNYKRRAERRRTFYERIKADPTQFMQIHGRPYKIHLDPSIAQAADSPANMMPWLGDKENLIDRFDVRANLDHIPEQKPVTEPEKISKNTSTEDRQMNYERYRILVQSDFLGMSEEKFLHQIYLEERCGSINRSSEEEKKKLADKKAAIGYVYDDSTHHNVGFGSSYMSAAQPEEEKDDEDDDFDLDMAIEYEQLTSDQKSEMNSAATKYGMVDQDFMLYMGKDKEEAIALKLARELEEEKAMYSGRKSRRERRAFREKRLQGRKISPPSYAAKKSPTYEPYERSMSRSKSRSPENCGQITFITSFGDDPEPEPKLKPQTSSSKKLSNQTQQPRKKEAAKPSKEYKEYGPQAQPPGDSSSSKHHSRNSKSPKRRRSRSPIRSRTSYKRRSSSASDRSPSRSYRSVRSRSPAYRHGKSYSSARYDRRTPPRRYSRSPSRRRYRDDRRSDHRDTRSRSNDRKRHSSRRRSSSKSSRSRSPSSHSSSRSSSSSSRSSVKSSKSHTRTKSKSKSNSPRPVRRYRRNSRSLSPRSEVDSDSNNSSNGSPPPKGRQSASNVRLSTSGNSSAVADNKAKLTPQERLKKKMQLALNKQYKADKVAEQQKIMKQEKMQKDREVELREMSMKMRRRDRERRHQQQGYRRSHSNSRSDSSSDRSSRSPSPMEVSD